MNTTARTFETFWYARSPVPTPLGLAVQLGWIAREFVDDNLVLRPLEEAADPILRESHYDHHLDNLIRQGGSAPAIWARARGRATRVIGLNWIDESQLIVTLPDSGIRRPRDLRGRRLALPRYSDAVDHRRACALRGYIVALEIAGLTYKDVEFVDVEAHLPPDADGHPAVLGSPQPSGGGYTDEIFALIRGEVDAIYVKGAHGVQLAQQLRTHIVTDLRHHPDPLVRTNNAAPRPVTVDQSLLDRHPDFVARFLARIVAVGPWARTHALETVAYIACQTRTTNDWVRSAYGSDVYRRLVTDLDELSISGLDAYKKFLLQWGFLKEDFDTWDWVDPAPLAEVQRQNRRRAA